MNLPKTDDNDRTDKNDVSTLSWHMVNASFWASTYKQFKSLVFGSRRLCASSNTVL